MPSLVEPTKWREEVYDNGWLNQKKKLYNKNGEKPDVVVDSFLCRQFQQIDCMITAAFRISDDKVLNL